MDHWGHRRPPVHQSNLREGLQLHARSTVGKCVFLLKHQGPNHTDKQPYSCIQKRFFFQAWLFQKAADVKERTAYHFMPEKKHFWTIYVIKDKANSVNKAKIQEDAIGINLFKAVY